VELQSRLVEASDRLRAKHPGEVIVAVSHADCIKAVLASALGVPLDLFQRIMVGTCSTSVVAYGATGPMVLAMNSYAPMDRLLPSAATPAVPAADAASAPKVSVRRRSRRATSAATDGG
jgi:probable phosphoglycerate mutase